MTRRLRWRDDLVCSFMASLLVASRRSASQIEAYLVNLMSCAIAGAKQGDC